MLSSSGCDYLAVAGRLPIVFRLSRIGSNQAVDRGFRATGVGRFLLGGVGRKRHDHRR